MGYKEIKSPGQHHQQATVLPPYKSKLFNSHNGSLTVARKHKPWMCTNLHLRFTTPHSASTHRSEQAAHGWAVFTRTDVLSLAWEAHVTSKHTLWLAPFQLTLHRGTNEGGRVGDTSMSPRLTSATVHSWKRKGALPPLLQHHSSASRWYHGLPATSWMQRPWLPAEEVSY